MSDNLRMAILIGSYILLVAVSLLSGIRRGRKQTRDLIDLEEQETTLEKLIEAERTMREKMAEYDLERSYISVKWLMENDCVIFKRAKVLRPDSGEIPKIRLNPRDLGGERE